MKAEGKSSRPVLQPPLVLQELHWPLYGHPVAARSRKALAAFVIKAGMEMVRDVGSAQ